MRNKNTTNYPYNFHQSHHFLSSDQSMTDLTRTFKEIPKSRPNYPKSVQKTEKREKNDEKILSFPKRQSAMGHKNRENLCILGIFFTFSFFPQFNAAYHPVTPYHKSLTIINTILALSSSLITSAAISSYFCSTNHRQYKVETIMSGCMAGGVIIGSLADLVINPCVTLLVSCLGGCISWLLMERWR